VIWSILAGALPPIAILAGSFWISRGRGRRPSVTVYVAIGLASLGAATLATVGVALNSGVTLTALAAVSGVVVLLPILQGHRPTLWRLGAVLGALILAFLGVVISLQR
jgi:hypothetical protein